jgi:stearoyl-CoA desaturase (delta-9 desaturase)
MGYHRLLTHRGYKTSRFVEYFLTMCGSLALESGPICWVATHRIHHQYSDRNGDPHSPLDGKWWSHIGWILTGKAMHHDPQTLQRYAPELCRSPFHVRLKNWHWVPLTVLGLVH